MTATTVATVSRDRSLTCSTHHIFLQKLINNKKITHSLVVCRSDGNHHLLIKKKTVKLTSYIGTLIGVPPMLGNTKVYKLTQVRTLNLLKEKK